MLLIYQVLTVVLAATAGNMGSICVLGRSLKQEMVTLAVLLPGKSHGQRNLAAAVHGVATSGTQLSNQRTTTVVTTAVPKWTDLAFGRTKIPWPVGLRTVITGQLEVSENTLPNW